jgi:hypothetical protein
MNLLLILYKCYIYKQRAKKCKPVLTGYQDDVKSYYFLEKYICKKNMRETEFTNRWSSFVQLYDRPQGREGEINIE